MNIKSMRLYIFDNGFNENFMLGVANYSTNLFIHQNMILNRVYDIEVEFTYENLVQTIQDILGYDRDYVSSIMTEENFEHLAKYYAGLQDLDVAIEGYSPAIFIRPFFLFLNNIQFYTDLKKMPADTFPQSVDIILFDHEAYQGNWAKDPFALSDTVYRLNWKKNPVWVAPNLKEIIQYKQQFNFHHNEVFAKRNDKAILSVAPTELGFPETFAPQEKRSVNFEVGCNHIEEFKIKVNLWVTSNVARFIVLKKEITNNYHFTATPRGWNTAIKL